MRAQGLLQLLGSVGRRISLTKAAITLFTGLVFLQLLPRDAKVFLLSQPMATSCTSEQIEEHYSCDAHSRKSDIPNIVNFVYILKDPVSGTFPLQFSHYLSLFAAWYRWRPDIIYLHTNVEANSSAVLRAQSGAAGKWAQRFFEIPGLVINKVSVPTHAGNGRELTKMEHKSDFVRVQAVYQFGGIYIDMDVHALRDITALRTAGYGSVAGWQGDGFINSGTFMSEKGGRMAKLWMERMNQVYDGAWTTHSNRALTKLDNELRKEPCEMLVVKPAVFAPMGWRWFHSERLLSEHFEASGFHFDEAGNLPEFPDDFTEPINAMSWARDWRCTILLHAFSAKKERNGIKDNGISPRYVIERTSNFARAVYPMVRVMYEKGFIDKQDIVLP